MPAPWLTPRAGQVALNSLKKLGLYLQADRVAGEATRKSMKPHEWIQYLSSRVKPAEMNWTRAQELLGNQNPVMPIQREGIGDLLEQGTRRLHGFTKKGAFGTYGEPGEKPEMLRSLLPKYRESFISVEPVDRPLTDRFRPSHFESFNSPVLFDLRRRLGTLGGQRAHYIDEAQSTWYQHLGEPDVPDYPLGNKYNWDRLAMLHALRLAALDPKAQHLTWSQGAGVAGRYNLGNYLKKLRVRYAGVGAGNEDDHHWRLEWLDQHGKVGGKLVHEKDLPRMVGKPVVEFVSGIPKAYTPEWTEVPIHDSTWMGAKWPLELYDQRIPNTMRRATGLTPTKGVTKIGARNTGIKRASWGIPISNELRRRVLEEGFPLFSIPAAITGTTLHQQRAQRGK